MKIKNPTDAEATGPLSSVLSAASNLATVMYNNIPVPTLSGVLGPTAWFLRAASNAASSFGYSNTIDTRPPIVKYDGYSQYKHNADGADVTMNLGLVHDAHVAPMKLGGRDEDEMSIDFIKAICVRTNMFTWSTTDGRGVTLHSQDHIISGYVNAESGADKWMPSTVAYLSNFTRYWRGDIRLTFSVASTQFHSGKLLIGFIPRNANDDVIPAVDVTYDYHSVLWDISATKTIDFVVPFMYYKAWATRGEDMGQIFVSVVTPLVAPTNVSTSVPIVMSVCGTESFAVASVRGMHETVATQADFVTTSTQEAELYCIGSALRSMKQLLNLAEQVYPTKFSILDPPADEYSFSFVEHATNDAATPTTRVHSAIINSYHFWRGGYRVFAYGPKDVVIKAYLENRSTTVAIAPTRIDVTVPYESVTSRTKVTEDRQPKVHIAVPTDTAMLFEAYAADDFQLGYFTHTPWQRAP